MKIIVPLAGPDFILENGSTKAEIEYCGDDILHYILKKRPWYKYTLSTDYIFVLQDTEQTRSLVNNKLKV